jgi:hypothetical protein
MINPQCFEQIIMYGYVWKFVDHNYRGYADYKYRFNLFDWDEIFVVNFDDIETRSIILNRKYRIR